MNTTIFNTLAYAKKLQSVGFTEQQAEVQAEAIAEIIDSNLATKRDVAEIKRDIEQFRVDVKRDIKDTEYKLTIRMGAFAVAVISILAAIIKL
jgi:hypothetical protein